MRNLRYLMLGMNYDLFMFIWVELREKWKLDQRNEKESKMGEVESS